LFVIGCLLFAVSAQLRLVLPFDSDREACSRRSEGLLVMSYLLLVICFYLMVTCHFVVVSYVF